MCGGGRTRRRPRRQLLADISHELKTLGRRCEATWTRLRSADIALDPSVRDRYLSIVSREEQRLERIVGELLDLARLEARDVTVGQEADGP